MKPEHRAFLAELQNHPAWAQILKELSQSRPAPRYRPSRSSEDEVGKVHKMIYQSGRFDENRSLIFQLSLGQIGEDVNE